MSYPDNVKDKARELREKGATYPEIADALGRELPKRPDDRTIERWLSPKALAVQPGVDRQKVPAKATQAIRKPLSLRAVAHHSPFTGALRPYGQTPILWADVQVTNAGPSTLRDVELWVTDVAREGESAIPFAWSNGEYKIAIPARSTRTARLLSCDDENGFIVTLGPLRRLSGTLRVELEASSPDSATVKEVISVGVTPRKLYRQELELREDAGPAVAIAYRRCKEILNKPSLPWRPIIDLRKVPHRVEAAPVGSKARTPYEKIADTYIAADEAIKELRASRGAVVVDSRVKRLEELRLEVGEDVWASLPRYFPIHERPANIEVKPWDER